MSVMEQALLDALKQVIDPNTGKDFVSTKAIKNLVLSEGDVTFDVELGYPAKSQIPGFRKLLIAAAKNVSAFSRSDHAAAARLPLPGAASVPPG